MKKVNRNNEKRSMNKIAIFVIIFFVICGAVLFAKKDAIFVTPTQTQSLAANLEDQPYYNEMALFIKTTSATADYEGEQTYTVFAPTDPAFAKLPKETLEMLRNRINYERNVKVEDNHVVIGDYPTSSFNDGMQLTTVHGEVITLTMKDGSWYINNAIKIVQPDITSKNGVIHGIDTVMLPKDL